MGWVCPCHSLWRRIFLLYFIAKQNNKEKTLHVSPFCAYIRDLLLADHTAARNMIRYCHDVSSECLSVYLRRSVLRRSGRRRGMKVVGYHRVHSRALPIHFFKHFFCCRMYRSATAQSENPNHLNYPPLE